MFSLLSAYSISDSAPCREYLSGGATPGCGQYGESELDGPATNYAIYNNNSSAYCWCKEQDDACFTWGYDCDVESWYIEINLESFQPSPSDGCEELYLDPTDNYFKSRVLH